MDWNWSESDYWYCLLDLFIKTEANNYADKVVWRHYVSCIPFCYECQLFGFLVICYVWNIIAESENEFLSSFNGCGGVNIMWI